MKAAGLVSQLCIGNVLLLCGNYLECLTFWGWYSMKIKIRLSQSKLQSEHLKRWLRLQWNHPKKLFRLQWQLQRNHQKLFRLQWQSKHPQKWLARSFIVLHNYVFLRFALSIMIFHVFETMWKNRWIDAWRSRMIWALGRCRRSRTWGWNARGRIQGNGTNNILLLACLKLVSLSPLYFACVCLLH